MARPLKMPRGLVMECAEEMRGKDGIALVGIFRPDPNEYEKKFKGTSLEGAKLYAVGVIRRDGKPDVICGIFVISNTMMFDDCGDTTARVELDLNKPSKFDVNGNDVTRRGFTIAHQLVVGQSIDARILETFPNFIPHT